MAPTTMLASRAVRQGLCASLNLNYIDRASSSDCRPFATSAHPAPAVALVSSAGGFERGGCGVSARAAARACMPPGGPRDAEAGGESSKRGSACSEGGRIAGWACIERCGACCQLDKGELAPPVETILRDAGELAMYRSMVGDDGWCRHYDRQTRACSIYESRPRFCRVQADVFWDLYRIAPHQLASSARSFCRVSIADVYGPRSDEMKRFKAANGKSRGDAMQR
ncbi:hypothetical protein CLOP_g2320 [Closterium sp. NIES-67]|nr:hypothetical protein CLOP_g2320 [Closterium sp. NIES-67]